MPAVLGAHSRRVADARALLTPKGRREQRRFLFEGPTLLAEACASDLEIDALYITRAAYETTPLAREIEARGLNVSLVDERTAARLSDVETPTGIVAVAKQRFAPLRSMLAQAGPAIVLADLSDPGNAGTILRSAEAFGACGAIFGSRGVEPYHPKVVRAAMGSIFRIPIATSEPQELSRVAVEAGRAILGLSREGAPLERAAFPEAAIALVVGQERHGLGVWKPLCSLLFSIPIRDEAESLNAAVAASIALYEASRR
jgi:TrmH family RNA methyltransferase